jgi:hypothetical protein
MTAAEFEVLHEDEAERIIRWRFEVLSDAGYNWDEALQLAAHVEADLHIATGLLNRGCPSGTALRILL